MVICNVLDELLLTSTIFVVRDALRSDTIRSDVSYQGIIFLMRYTTRRRAKRGLDYLPTSPQVGPQEDGPIDTRLHTYRSISTKVTGLCVPEGVELLK